MILVELIVGVAILCFALIDIKERAIPSFITTTVILGLLLIQPENLIWGISAFVFGWLLYELDFLGGRFFGGIADVKVMTIIGLMVTSLSQFATMMIITSGISVITAIIIYYKNDKKMPEEIPFIPALLVVYIFTVIIGRVL